MTSYELACDIINKNTVQPCKFSPRGPLADAVVRFMGRAAGHETFITEAQAAQLGTTAIITHGTTTDDKFAGFVKTVWSDKTKKNYYLLTFCGNVVDTAAPLTLAGQKAASADQAHAFAAKLITGAISKGYAKKDERAAAGEDDYLCVWLTKGQSDMLLGLLACVPTAINQAGNIITQPVGAFCYWSKVRAASGCILLCWMGEVADMPTVAATVTPNVPAGKLIPLDIDIPF